MASPLLSTGDPLRMRELLQRASALASEHSVRSVFVGLAAPEGDLVVPDVIAFVESELRVDDAILRVTRERAVLWLADVDRERAEEVVQRSLAGFRQRFPAPSEGSITLRFYEVAPGVAVPSVKEVLPALF